MSVKRFDAIKIERFERTPQGGLRIPANLTSTGVFPYQNEDGSVRRELRHPDEVFKPASVNSLKNAPVTDLHPAEPVTPANWKILTVGHTAEDIVPKDTFLVGSVLIQDMNEIRMIESGDRKELSCGYSIDLDMTGGVFNGEPYDCIQRNITYNHVGIGPEGWGRQGSSVAIRLDSGDAIQLQRMKSETRMKTIRIDGIDYEIGTEAHLQAVARRDAAQQAKLSEQEAQIASLLKERDAAIGRADAADKLRADAEEKLKAATDPKTIHTQIKQRADMLDKLRKIHRLAGKRFDAAAEEAAATSSDQDQLIMAIKVMDPSFDPANKTPDEIRGYFAAYFKSFMAQRGAEETAEGDPEMETDTSEEDPENPDMPEEQKTPGRTDSRGGTIHGARRGGYAPRKDSRQEPNAAEAQERSRQDSANAWQKPLAFSKDRQN